MAADGRSVKSERGKAVPRWILAIVLFFTPVQSGTAAEVVVEAATPDDGVAANLSGVWRGTVTIRQTGSCPLFGGPVGRGFPIERTAYLFDVEADGTFSARWIDAHGEPSTDRGFDGSIGADLEVHATKHVVSLCNGVEETSESAYSGSVQRKRRRHTLELLGEDEACGEANCRFSFFYKLSKKGG